MNGQSKSASRGKPSSKLGRLVGGFLELVARVEKWKAIDRLLWGIYIVNLKQMLDDLIDYKVAKLARLQAARLVGQVARPQTCLSKVEACQAICWGTGPI